MSMELSFFLAPNPIQDVLMSNKTSEDTTIAKESSLFAKIKKIVLHSLYVVIYYLSCCQIDLRKRVTPAVTDILSYMARNHKGAKRKIEFELPSHVQPKSKVTAWYEVKDGTRIIQMKYANPEGVGEEEKEITYVFTKAGAIEQVLIDLKDANPNGLSYQTYFLTRLLIHTLQKKCKLPQINLFKVLTPNLDKQKGSLEHVIKFLEMMKSLGLRIGYFHGPCCAKRNVKLSIQEEPHAIKFDLNKNMYGYQLKIEGCDLDGEILAITAHIHDKTFRIEKIVVDNKIITKTSDKGFQEAMLWIDQYQGYLELQHSERTKCSMAIF